MRFHFLGIFCLLSFSVELSAAEKVVTYEEFGAKGDGVTDDLPAICKAHAHANENNLRVRSKPGATYHLGGKSLTAIISTDTDWNTSRFIIDDSTAVNNPNKPLFEVRSQAPSIRLKIKSLKRGQRSFPLRPSSECIVLVENFKKKNFIRKGKNENDGNTQREVFLLRKDGSIPDGINWDYDVITKIEAKRIDDNTLFLKGGVFSNIPNRLSSGQRNTYWMRNIEITRSKTVVDGVTQTIKDHGKVSHPYKGFLYANQCAYVAFRNCKIDARRIQRNTYSSGKSVLVGTYGYGANLVSDFRMINCSMGNDIMDTSLWGIVGTNYMKNFLVEGCSLNRVDVHQGVAGSYIIRRTTIGHAGINAIGAGQLIVEDSTLNGSNLISFREDYGSTWDGDVVIRNSKWTPKKSDFNSLAILGLSNDEDHDFGYPCFMPRNIEIDGLTIDDSKHGKNYKGPTVLGDPLGNSKSKADYLFRPTERIEMKKISVTSGLPVGVSSDDSLTKKIKVSK